MMKRLDRVINWATIGAACFLIILIWAWAASGQGLNVAERLWPNVQRQNIITQENVSAANTAVSIGWGGGAGRIAHLYSYAARCSAGTGTVTVTVGGIQIYSTATGAVGTANLEKTWPVGLTVTAISQAINVTLSACGVGNTGTLSVTGDFFV